MRLVVTWTGIASLLELGLLGRLQKLGLRASKTCSRNQFETADGYSLPHRSCVNPNSTRMYGMARLRENSGLHTLTEHAAVIRARLLI